jgi:hypothetical protein
MFNVVHDNLPHSNVWFASKRFEQAFSPRHEKPLPKFLHLHDNLSFHSSADGLDSFIYPVAMHEPYIQARSLIANQNPFGFWSYVSDSVIAGLKEKRGWIIIDIFSEPISQYDFDCVLESLSDCSEFPNDRVLLNTTSPHFVKHSQVVCNPSFLEMGCYSREIEGRTIKYLKNSWSEYAPCPCYRTASTKVHYPHKRFLLLNQHIDYQLAELFAKYAKVNSDSFLARSGRPVLPLHFTDNILRLPDALYATDVNVVIEAYVDNDSIDYPFITEKTYRNIKYKKPFILMGQHHTLAAFHNLGYKTFHPLIDESYDEIEDTKLRCLAVLRELDRLRQMGNNEWSRFLELCKPILEHNYNNLLNRVSQTNAWLEGLKNL